MFKYSKLILIILICLVTFAIGYALFSGNVKVSSLTSVDPTDINIATTCGVVNPDNPYNSSVYTTEGVENAQILCSENNIEFSATHLYPGTKQSYWIKITNNSSFDVMIKGMDVEGNVGNDIDEYNQIFSGVAEIFDSSNKTVGLGLYGIENETEDNKNSLSCIKEEDCVMQPGETYTLTLTDSLSDSIEGNSMNIEINRTLRVNIEQHN